MHKHVSKRHKTSPTNVWGFDFRNSESSTRPLAVQMLPVWPNELRDRSRSGRKNLIAIIERALRKERRRANAGDRAYDLARHADLVRLLREERDALKKMIARD